MRQVWVSLRDALGPPALATSPWDPKAGRGAGRGKPWCLCPREPPAPPSAESCPSGDGGGERRPRLGQSARAAHVHPASPFSTVTWGSWMTKSGCRAGDAPRCHLDTVPPPPRLMASSRVPPSVRPHDGEKGDLPTAAEGPVQVHRWCPEGAGPAGLRAGVRAGSCTGSIQEPRAPPKDAPLRVILGKPRERQEQRPRKLGDLHPRVLWTPAPSRIPAGWCQEHVGSWRRGLLGQGLDPSAGRTPSVCPRRPLPVSSLHPILHVPPPCVILAGGSGHSEAHPPSSLQTQGTLCSSYLPGKRALWTPQGCTKKHRSVLGALVNIWLHSRQLDVAKQTGGSAGEALGFCAACPSSALEQEW